MAAALFVAAGLSPAVVPAFGEASAQTVNEILARHYEAIGGLDAWRALETMRSAGAIRLMGGAADGAIVVSNKRPDMLRAEIIVQGTPVIQAYDGTTAWTVNPFAGATEPAPADAATTAAMAEQADVDGPLVGWAEDGHALSFEGMDEVEGASAYRLRLDMAGGTVSTYYLDATTHLIVRIESERELTGRTTTNLLDYREVSGLVVPFTVVSTSRQGDQAVSWDTIEFGVELDDALFRMP